MNGAPRIVTVVPLLNYVNTWTAATKIAGALNERIADCPEYGFPTPTHNHDANVNRSATATSRRPRNSSAPRSIAFNTVTILTRTDMTTQQTMHTPMATTSQPKSKVKALVVPWAVIPRALSALG